MGIRKKGHSKKGYTAFGKGGKGGTIKKKLKCEYKSNLLKEHLNPDVRIHVYKLLV